MYLTREEERALAGELGEAAAVAMRVVVKVGEALGAERLVRIKSAHISGVSYRNLGQEGLEFLEELAAMGARFAVPATLNPGGMDLRLWREMGVREEEYRVQARIVKALIGMGAEPSLTCTPYLFSDVGMGDHLAWAESNAVLYANSVIGARTNREGGPFSVFEAIAGRAPFAGLHTDEGREPTAVVELGGVRELVDGEGLYSLLGYVVGREVGTGVPLIVDPPAGLRDTGNLKLFLAAMGASSSVGLALIEGISPEFKPPAGDVERVPVDEGLLREERERWESEQFDAVVVGCPHLSMEEVGEIHVFLRGRSLRARLMLFTSRRVVEEASGIVDSLRRMGVEVFADTCMVVGNLEAMGVKSCVTDSAKAAFYLSSRGFRVAVKPRGEALRLAVSG